MANTTCWHCKHLTHLTARYATKREVTDGPDAGHLLQAAYSCDNCHRLSIASLRHQTNSTVDQSTIESLFVGKVLQWMPRVGVAPAIEDVPDHITAAAKEAFSAASIGANMAAILMARTTLEATAKEKGHTSGTLLVKIDAMKAANLIRPDIAEAAHEVRHFGNDMAHGDIGSVGDQPTAQDVEDVLSLMMQVLAEVFQGPALVDRLRQRRSATT